MTKTFGSYIPPIFNANCRRPNQASSHTSFQMNDDRPVGTMPLSLLLVSQITARSAKTIDHAWSIM